MSENAAVAYPTGWRRMIIGEVLERIADQAIVDPKKTYREIGIRSHGKGLFDKKPISGSALGNKRVFWVKPDCIVLNIVFAWEQAVGRTTKDDLGKIASHRFPMYRPNSNLIDIDYILYFFKTERGRQLLEIASPGGAGRNKTLGQEEFKQLPLCLPPVAEQHRIAKLLSTWDKAIDQTERLIIAKRRRKAALVQKLFSNLPRRGLLEAADVWFSGVNKKSIVGEDAIRLCNYMDVFHNARITPALDFMRATASGREIETNTLRRHDVVFTKDSETAEEIAECALVAEQIDDLVCGYHLAVARPREGQAYGPFLAQALRHPEIRWQFSRLANGVVRFGLTLDAIEQAEIFLPDISVQHHIAAVLDAEDSAAEALTRRASHFRTQKRGLMQKLLTGEWRLDGRFDEDALTPHVLAAARAL
jgi:type I restriction enzyme S subunit